MECGGFVWPDCKTSVSEPPSLPAPQYNGGEWNSTSAAYITEKISYKERRSSEPLSAE